MEEDAAAAAVMGAGEAEAVEVRKTHLHLVSCIPLSKSDIKHATMPL